ncbi:hybrid sensor histidine kinase/response regulator [Limnobacter alexandrii]|jgi:signal transduction histidine kinase/CheY-like chemotaxis protein/HPt (histidine-containing phosphotransfer) domain-containing protein|uniref:hybrid sensor histidine kinase/response regulator n=1 Tax=Limnobacter alexandrii TaxID=2570352 RepID=UPI001108711A|nr:ATP-binding protein [Limnobacter alexandrii]
MKLTLLIRIFGLLILVFSIFGIGVKSISIHQQTVQEDYYQAWASDEAILARTLAEFEAMRKLVLLYAASRNPEYINHYLDIVGLHNGSRIYTSEVGADYWVDVITGQNKEPAVSWGIGQNLSERLYSLRFIAENEPAIERILDLRHQLEKNELSAFASGITRFVDKQEGQYLSAPEVKETFGVLFDREHIELTNALSAELSSFIAREKSRYLGLIDASRKELTYSVYLDVVFTLLFLLGLFIGLVSIKKKVIDPINSLYNASEEIMKGDYTVRVNNRTGSHEINLLIRAFNRMIRSFQRDLEKSERVKQALEEVSLANVEKERAKNESRIKSSFLANMSHEIRTPMNAILGMTALTLKTDLNEKQKDYLTKIQLSGDNLLHLLNSILDLSKIESDMFKLEQRPFRLDDVLEEVFGTLGNSALDKNIRLLYTLQGKGLQSTLNRLVGDSLRVGQILKNLIGNAIKFTSEGHVNLTVKVLKQLDEQVTLQFSVSDTGIGMSKDQLQRVFDKFTQADSSTTRMFGGSGLGLSIAKELVHLMEGDIHAHSTPGRGSVFYFTLNLKTQETEAPARNPNLLHGPDIKRAYICSLDQKLHRSISSILDQFYVPLAALSAEELVTDQRPFEAKDIVFIDSDIAATSPELLSLLKAHHQHHNNNLVWLSNRNAAELQRIHGADPNNRVLTTPILPVHLMKLAERHVKQATPKTTSKTAAPHKTTKTIEAENSNLIEARTAKLLIVEDHPLNMELLLDFLSPKNYQIRCAKDGREAIQILKNTPEPFDLMISDLEMPFVDGYQLATWVRENAVHCVTPIMALTAHAFEQTRVRCEEHGINDVLTKPFHEKNLFEAIKRCLRNTEGVLTGFETRSETSRLPLSEHAATAPEPTNTPRHSAIFKVDSFEPERMAKYLGKFLQTSENLIERLEDCAKTNDTQTLKREIHSLAGVLGMLGTESVKQQFSRMDKALEDPAAQTMVMAEIKDVWPTIVDEAEKILVLINRFGKH